MAATENQSLANPAVFAVANQKGGVAKTTNTINLAGAASSIGYRTLVIDADPQGYLTNRLGLDEEYTSEDQNLYDAFLDPRSYDLRSLIKHHAEFDVIPSNVDMFALEQDLIASGRQPRHRLSTLFQQLDETTYDLVLVDAPPSLGPINDNVILAAQNLLVPCEADDTSVLALQHLLDQVESLEGFYDVTIRERAILVSNVNYPLDNEQQRMLEWYEETFGDRCPIHIIRHRAAIKRAMNSHRSIFAESAEESDMRAVYRAVIDDLAIKQKGEQ